MIPEKDHFVAAIQDYWKENGMDEAPLFTLMESNYTIYFDSRAFYVLKQHPEEDPPKTYLYVYPIDYAKPTKIY